MKTYLNFALLLAVASLLVQSCDSDSTNCMDGIGPDVTDTLELSDFTGIRTTGTHDIYIQKGAQQQVVVIGQQNVIDRLSRDVNAGIWDASLTGDCFGSYRLTIYVRIPELSVADGIGTGYFHIGEFSNLDILEITISGTGGVFQTGTLTASDRIDITSTGTGFIDAVIEVPDVCINQTGTGNILLRGSCSSQDVKITGTGNYLAFGLTSETCNLLSTGTGDAQISVNDLLNVTITGTGDVYYRGFPEINSTITGSGRLIEAN